MNKVNELGSVGENTTKQEAEENLVSALLEQLYASEHEKKSNTEQRINRVMAALEQDELANLKTTADKGDEESNSTKADKSSNLVYLSFNSKKWFGLAASLVFFMFSVSLLIMPSKNAMAEVDQLLVNLSSLVDRVYRVSVSPIDNKSSKENREKTNSWLNDAQLYMRGTSQYLVMANTEKGRLIKARNETSSWKLDHKSRVKFYPDEQKIKLPVSGRTASLAFMDLPLLLDTLAKNYQLTYQENVKRSELTDQALSLIVAHKNSSDIKGAKTIELYYQTESYLIEEMSFDRVHMQGKQDRYQLMLSLEQQTKLSDDFFQPQFHTTRPD